MKARQKEGAAICKNVCDPLYKSISRGCIDNVRNGRTCCIPSGWGGQHGLVVKGLGNQVVTSDWTK